MYKENLFRSMRTLPESYKKYGIRFLLYDNTCENYASHYICVVKEGKLYSLFEGDDIKSQLITTSDVDSDFVYNHYKWAHIPDHYEYPYNGFTFTYEGDTFTFLCRDRSKYVVKIENEEEIRYEAVPMVEVEAFLLNRNAEVEGSDNA